MKIRNGFVSNSSTSSFLVVRIDSIFNKPTKIFITKEEEKLLVKFGFKKVYCYFSDQVEDELFSKKKPLDIKEYYNLGYYVGCNQDDVILFLLENNISFEATCHYGDEKVIYKSGEKYFIVVQNYGSQCKGFYSKKSYKEMMEYIDLKNPIRKENVKKWIKNAKKWKSL